MAVQTTLTNNYTKAVDAKAAAKSSYESGKIGTTDRGTAIVEKNNGLGKNAFLNLLVAQLKNMDPTQNQDSTAYVSQMAQFSSIEQMNNLNTTMQDFAYEQMVGKVAILSDTDSNGNNKSGIISKIIKDGSTTNATILDPKTGTYSNYSMNKIIGTSDSGYGSANYETALNSNFSAASTLARDNATAVYVEVTSKNDNEGNDGQNTTVTTTTKTAHKCIIEKAYLDKQNSVVKVTIKLEDGTTKTVDYSTIAVAGKDLSDDVVNETIKNNTTEPVVTRNTTTISNNSLNSDDTNKLIKDENKFLSGFSG